MRLKQIRHGRKKISGFVEIAIDAIQNQTQR